MAHIQNGIDIKMTRRRLLQLLTIIALPVRAPQLKADTEDKIIHDAVGRQVRLKKPPQRIVLLDARDIVTMGVLDPKTHTKVVGWAGVDRFDSELIRQQYEQISPHTNRPIVGEQTPASLSIEHIVALAPDVVIATAEMEPSLGRGLMAKRLAAADIALVFSNANSNRPTQIDASPFQRLRETMNIWGQLLAQPTRSASFITFVEQHLTFIRERLQQQPTVKTYLELQSTYDDCCWAAGRRIWGALLELAGGHHLDGATDPWYTQVALEQLLAESPEVYIASGGTFSPAIRPAIGPGLDPSIGQAGLQKLIDRPGFETLPAVKNQRVHGIWTGLLSLTPLNILFVEITAKWLHPSLFSDLDPEQTRQALNQQFLLQPIPSPCWISLAQHSAHSVLKEATHG